MAAVVDCVEVLTAHAHQAAAGGRVAAGHFSSLKLLADGPVLVVDVEVFAAQAPQTAAGGRVTAVFDNVEVFVARAPQAAAGGHVAGF